MSEIDDHMKLVRSVAFRMRREGLRYPLEDMIGAGMLGLVDAMEKYQDNRGATFKTYARLRIRGAILDEVRRMNHGTRSMQQAGESPKIRSLDAPADDTEDTNWHEALADPTVDITESVEDKTLQQTARDQIYYLPDRREQLVLQGLYLDGKKASEISVELGCSPSNVTLIKRKALINLRERMEAWA